jgi:hypothetical protein
MPHFPNMDIMWHETPELPPVWMQKFKPLFPSSISSFSVTPDRQTALLRWETSWTFLGDANDWSAMLFLWAVSTLGNDIPDQRCRAALCHQIRCQCFFGWPVVIKTNRDESCLHNPRTPTSSKLVLRRAKCRVQIWIQIFLSAFPVILTLSIYLFSEKEDLFQEQYTKFANNMGWLGSSYESWKGLVLHKDPWRRHIWRSCRAVSNKNTTTHNNTRYFGHLHSPH